MTAVPESDPYLLFRSGPSVGALALGHVREIMRPLPIEFLAGVPAFVLGVAIVRGFACPVIDAGSLLHSGTAATNAATRFVSLRLGTRNACLAVDAVLEVRTLGGNRLEQTPPLLHQADAALTPLLGALDRELLMVLNAARMVPDQVWSKMHTDGHDG